MQQVEGMQYFKTTFLFFSLLVTYPAFAQKDTTNHKPASLPQKPVDAIGSVTGKVHERDKW